VKLALFPDPVLLRRADEIEEITPEIRERATRMIDVMGLEDGIGLAAPQVGWGVRILVASPEGTREGARIMVNPEILERSGGSEWDQEGCLSFPGIFGEVLRARQVRVRYRDLDGEEHEELAEELYARVLQHEIDHLDGILFVTKMRPADKALNKSRLAELRRRYEQAQASVR
jgi:peptide deformylase